MDRYHQLIQWLFGLRRMLYSCESPDLLHQAIGEPAKYFPSVHITGTNGKGSVAIKIAEAFRLNGYKVGLFTSPHLNSFRERIRINGEQISREGVVSYLDALIDTFKKKNLEFSFFEITTMLAFQYFLDQEVDIAVVEVGIGGRYDVTNVIHPILSIITSISKDHERYLGEGIDEIAYQKAGIIKKGVPVLVGYHAAHPKVFHESALKKAPMTVMPNTDSPFYWEENRAIAREAIRLLTPQYAFSQVSVEEAIEKEQPCRFEKVSYPGLPPVVFDVAHNDNGLRRLLIALKHFYPDKRLQFVMGMSKDKKIAECVEVLSSDAAGVYLLELKYSLSSALEELKETFQKVGMPRVVSFPKNEETLKQLLSDVKQETDVIVVCGSFYIMQAVQEFLEVSRVSKLHQSLIHQEGMD